MKPALLFTFIITLAAAAPAGNQSNATGTLSIPVLSRKKTSRGVSSQHQYAKRGKVNVPLKNDISTYNIEFNVGSPGQKVEAVLDTGSSDLLVFAKGDKKSYHPKRSKTYKFLSNDFSTEYVTGSATGDWVKDTVSVGPATVKNQQFGAVKSSNNVETGVFGIGLVANESPKKKYPNFPANLKKQGVIKSNIYSLFLDDIDAASGSILFGGVDKAKYRGKLAKVPLKSRHSFTVETSVNGLKFDGILDTGTSLAYLPDKLAQTIIKPTGAKFHKNYGMYITKKKPSKGLTFNFGPTKVTVPPKELAIPLSDFDIDEDGFALTVAPNSQADGLNLLGDSFLRSAYVVYDLENMQIQIAPASFNKKKSSIHTL